MKSNNNNNNLSLKYLFTQDNEDMTTYKKTILLNIEINNPIALSFTYKNDTLVYDSGIDMNTFYDENITKSYLVAENEQVTLYELDYNRSYSLMNYKDVVVIYYHHSTGDSMIEYIISRKDLSVVYPTTWISIEDFEPENFENYVGVAM